MIRLTAVALALALGALPLVACNTVHGLGKDIEATGRAIANLPDGDQKRPRAKARPAAQPAAAQNPSQRPPAPATKTGS